MCALLWVDGLQIVGSKSELAAQAEAQVHVGIVVDEFATCSRHEKRSRGAGRGSGVGIFFDAFTTGSRCEKRYGSAGRGTSPLCTVVGERAAYCGHDK